MNKSAKITTTAVAGALLLTGALTAAVNAVDTPVTAAGTGSAPMAAAAVSVVDIQPAPETTVAQNRITATASAAAVQAALSRCVSDNLPFVTVALVDRFGTVQALLRGDNAAEHTIEAAQQKAYTAAAFGAPTSELSQRVTGSGPGIADLPGTLFLAGGVPLKVDGVSVAGIGVGGAPDGMLDESCAAAGAETIAGAAAGANSIEK
ncbi:heme-binding protein [Arthrobacter sp. Sa2CUA1]|uniref:Heme-binding protein n=1 Tax=Arthrobacter gallicola TaxID=2762225 RepID=A0ABR8UP86_9MICC|nr:heme-binding protein [Arthrobacter gallicola]MBD7994373.1 heme-binding protein [Arthrobacter gallicola]